MRDCPSPFERGHLRHETRFIKVPGGPAPQGWRFGPSRPGARAPGVTIVALTAGTLLGALLYALLTGT